MADDPDGDDLLFERLQQSASGDAAVRQLLRRYRLLRRDYEHLLDRLGDMRDGPSPAATHPCPAEPEAAAPEARTDEARGSVGEGLIAPLLRLRDEYLTAVSGIQSIVTGLDGLAAAAPLTGQHAAPERGPQSSSCRAAEPAADDQAPTEQGQAAVRRMQVDVKGSGLEALLDFDERLSKVAGVGRVSIEAIDKERATLMVELSENADHR